MTATRPRPPRPARERVIGALIPAPIPRPPPAPAPLPVLPARQLPTGPDVPLLDIARLDRSGRLSARALLRALGWRAGHRVHIDVIDAAVLVTSAAAGRHAVGIRGDLALPLAVRQLCGITPGDAVVVAAYPCLDLLVIDPVGVVARLLGEVHAGLLGGA